MHFDLPDETELLRRTVRDFAEREMRPVAADYSMRTIAGSISKNVQRSPGRARHAIVPAPSPNCSLYSTIVAPVGDDRSGIQIGRHAGQDRNLLAGVEEHREAELGDEAVDQRLPLERLDLLARGLRFSVSNVMKDSVVE